MNFEQWFSLVDSNVQRIAGCSVDDLPDCDFLSWYEDETSAKAAARRAIRMANGGDDE